MFLSKFWKIKFHFKIKYFLLFSRSNFQIWPTGTYSPDSRSMSSSRAVFCRVLNLSRENRRPVSRPAQVKTFLKTGGFRLSNFTLISYNVMWILTIPVLPNLRTRELPNPSWLFSHSTGHLFQSSLLLVQPSVPEPLSHSAGHLFQSSLLLVQLSVPEPLSHSAGHLFQSSLLLVQLKCPWTTFPLGWSPLPVKSPIGPAKFQAIWKPLTTPHFGHFIQFTGLNC